MARYGEQSKDVVRSKRIMWYNRKVHIKYIFCSLNECRYWVVYVSILFVRLVPKVAYGRLDGRLCWRDKN